MEDSRKENQRDVTEDGEYNKKIHALRLEVYTIEKEDLIKRQFLVFIMHPKGVNIVWTCIKYNTTEEKDQ